MNAKWPMILAVAVVVGAGAFYGGMRYGEGKSPTPQEALAALQNLTPDQAAQAFQNGNGFPGAGGGARRDVGEGGGFVNGDIIAADAQSITVQLTDGRSKIVFFSDSTSISRQAEGSASDLFTGTSVLVTGTTNDDGSITAQTIQIRPAGAAAFGPGEVPQTTPSS
ncbi:MAG: hypothetical protein M5U22_15810 [Thermoleophilia bacterium]|nr:hypothetical protein [Thermoleophilia bacterium]